MKPSYFYYIIQNHHQKGLDEKLLTTVSLAKDVLNNIENACSTFLVKDVLVSLCAKIVHIVIRKNIYFYYYYTIVPLVCNNANAELRRLCVVLVNCSMLTF